MDKENLESGIWKRILEVWNLDIGIPDLSAKTVAAHFWIGKLELGIGTRNLEGPQQGQGPRRGEERSPQGRGQSKALLLEEGGQEEERSPQGRGRSKAPLWEEDLRGFVQATPSNSARN